MSKLSLAVLFCHFALAMSVKSPSCSPTVCLRTCSKMNMASHYSEDPIDSKLPQCHCRCETTPGGKSWSCNKDQDRDQLECHNLCWEDGFSSSACDQLGACVCNALLA